MISTKKKIKEGKKMNTLNSYETVYVIKPDLGEETILQTIQKYQFMLVEKGVKNLIVQNRGRRHLSYPISDYKDGIYVQMNYMTNGEVLSTLEKSMRMSEEILRYISVCNNKVA